jgi:ubiquinone/menaquinone biosynthesis C-methylase UbiE
MAAQEELKQQQRQRWDAAAPGWELQDAWREQQTVAVTDWLCHNAGLAPGMRALDIACGSGQPALTVARRVEPGGRVVAIDLSSSMVAFANKRAAASGLSNLEFRQMDMEQLDFDDASFDAATCRWGLMFSPDPERAIREIHRVLKPGARLAAITWGDRASNPYMWIVGEAMTAFIDPGEAQGAGVAAAFSLSEAGALEDLVRAAGFSSVAVEAVPSTWEFATVEDFWENRVGQGGAAISGQVAQLSDDQRAAFKQRVLDAASQYASGGRVEFPAVSLGVMAQKSLP